MHTISKLSKKYVQDGQGETGLFSFDDWGWDPHFLTESSLGPLENHQPKVSP